MDRDLSGMDRDIIVNIDVSDDEKERILREEETWTAPKLIAVTAVVLGLSLILLVVLSRTPFTMTF